MRVEAQRARLTHPEANGYHGARLVHGQRCLLRGRIRADWLLAGEAAIQWIAEGPSGAAGAGAPLPACGDTAGTDSV